MQTHSSVMVTPAELLHEKNKYETRSDFPQLDSTISFKGINRTFARLGVNSLHRLSTEVEIPNYLDLPIEVSHAHIGPGDLFRSLIAASAHDCLQQRLPGHLKAGIAAISIRGNAAQINTLEKQDGLFTLTERGGQKDHLRVIGSIREWHNAKNNPSKVIELLSSPKITLLSMTIKKSGYALDHHNNLDFNKPEIASCLRSHRFPVCIYGFIVEALRMRKQRNIDPFVLLPCDNLANKGKVTKNAIVSFAREKAKHSNFPYKELADWIESSLICPNTVVDRITPHINLERPNRSPSRERWSWAQRAFGVWDGSPIITEPFKQLVIGKSDHGKPTFSKNVPAWIIADGVSLSDYVDNFEETKRLMLNGMHVAMGWIGTRAGMPKGSQTVQELMRSPGFKAFVTSIMNETIIPVLKEIPDVDLNEYSESLLIRFLNERLPDSLDRLNEGPSAKFPERIFPVIERAIRLNKTEGGSKIPLERLVLVVACWYLSKEGHSENGTKFKIIDSQPSIHAKVAKARSLEEFLAVSEIWVPESGELRHALPNQPEFRSLLAKMVKELEFSDVLTSIESRGRKES